MQDNDETSAGGGYATEAEVLFNNKMRESARLSRERRDARAQRVANQEIAKALKKGRGRKV